MCKRNLFRFGLIRRKAVEVYVEYGAPLLNLQGVGHGGRGEHEIARAAYVDKSRAFSTETRLRALRFIDRAEQRADSMSAEEFLLTVLQIPAFADNGHDVLNDNDDDGAWYPQARLPLRMIWFPEGWVIARAAPEAAELLGAKVTRIEGLSPAELLARLRRMCGGPDSYRRWNLEWIIESAGLLHALGLAERSDRLRLDLQLSDGRRVERSIAFVPRTTVPQGGDPVRLWSAELWPGEAEKGWRSAPARPQPLYLQEGAKFLRLAQLPELEALYVQFRAHYDSPDEKIADLMHSVDTAIAEHHPRHLVIDLRFDIGGNTELTRDWLRGLPDRIPDRIYVLVGRYTFSAGIVAAAALKHDGAARVRIVGETLADRLVFWSEGENVCLPTSHYCLRATTELWDLKGGCRGQAGCYADQYQVIVGTLRPDLPAPITIAAWLAGRDPGLEAVRRDLREHRLLTSPDSDFARFPKVKWKSPLVAGDRAR